MRDEGRIMRKEEKEGGREGGGTRRKTDSRAEKLLPRDAVADIH
jgi:hypothetical protein